MNIIVKLLFLPLLFSSLAFTDDNSDVESEDRAVDEDIEEEANASTKSNEIQAEDDNKNEDIENNEENQSDIEKSEELAKQNLADNKANQEKKNSAKIKDDKKNIKNSKQNKQSDNDDKKSDKIIDKKVEIAAEQITEINNMFEEGNVYFDLSKLTADELIFFLQQLQQRNVRGAYVTLSDNTNVTQDILRAIIELLENNPYAIKSLESNNVNIGDEGITILLGLDKESKKLIIGNIRHMILQNCGITTLPKECFNAFMQSEVEISLENNPLSPDTYAAVTHLPNIKVTPLEQMLEGVLQQNGIQQNIT